MKHSHNYICFSLFFRKEKKKSQLIYIYKQFSLVCNIRTLFLLLPERKKSMLIYFTISPMHLNYCIFFNDYRATGLACIKYQILKELYMKEGQNRPQGGQLSRMTGRSHGRSNTDCDKQPNKNIWGHSNSCWVHLCHEQCYGYGLYHVHKNMITGQ